MEQFEILQILKKNAILIRHLRNYEGVLTITFINNKYYWGLDSAGEIGWNEIPEALYNMLLIESQKEAPDEIEDKNYS